MCQFYYSVNCGKSKTIMNKLYSIVLLIIVRITKISLIFGLEGK